jgi:hypothetical protein
MLFQIAGCGQRSLGNTAFGDSESPSSKRIGKGRV